MARRKKIFLNIFVSLIIPVVIYFGIASVLTATGKPDKSTTVRPNSGDWAKPYTGRIVGLSMLNNVGIRWFNYLTVIEFNMPKEARDGTETLSYTFRMNTAYAPRNYKKDLGAIYQPLLVVAGTGDESFYADQFEPVISKYTKTEVALLEGVSHMGVVVGEEIQPAIKEWLEGLN